jgi:hypothetical protein
MGLDDPVQRLARLLKLVALTASTNENEARNSAMLACEILREHRDHVTFTDAPITAVHPLAALFRQHKIIPIKASAADWCIACAEAIEYGAPAAQKARVGMTHYKCRAWWAGFDFSTVPPDPFGGDDEVPF